MQHTHSSLRHPVTLHASSPTCVRETCLHLQAVYKVTTCWSELSCLVPYIAGVEDFYSFVRLVNYLRSRKPSAEQFASLLARVVTGTPSPWESDEYLVSVVQDDPMLQYGEEQGGGSPHTVHAATHLQTAECVWEGGGGLCIYFIYFTDLSFCLQTLMVWTVRTAMWKAHQALWRTRRVCSLG